MNEYCHCTIEGIELDEYLRRKDIVRIICTKCTKDYEHSDKNIFRYCEEHEPTPEQEAKEMARVDKQLNSKPYKEPKKRSDGKVDIQYKYRKCLTKAERRARKIDKRKHN